MSPSVALARTLSLRVQSDFHILPLHSSRMVGRRSHERNIHWSLRQIVDSVGTRKTTVFRKAEASLAF